MAIRHRSSEGPVPYGPPPQHGPGEGGSAGPGGGSGPVEGSAPGADDTTAWDLPPVPTPSGPAPSEPGSGAPTPAAWGPPPGPGAPPPSPGLPPPPGPPPPIMPWAPPPGAYGTVPGAPGLMYARTFDRVVAWWLDGLIVGVPALVLSLALGGGVLAAGGQVDGAGLVAGIVGVGIHLLYFVGFWTGAGRATPAMRLMKLQIGDAKSGATLTVQQGLVRWLALGGVFQVVELVPPLAGVVGLLAVVWALVLLASTATSPTKQGVHDRAADTAVVQPVGAQTGAAGCLVLAVIVLLIAFGGIVALVFLGSQISSILSAAGESV